LGFTRADAAQAAHDLIRAYVSLFALIREIPDVPKELMQVLKSLEVSMAGSVVRIGLHMTAAEFEALFEAMERLGDSEYDDWNPIREGPSV
jgi:hypothetical protein